MDTKKGKAYSIWDRCEYKQKVWFTRGIYAFIYNAPDRNRMINRRSANNI